VPAAALDEPRLPPAGRDIDVGDVAPRALRPAAAVPYDGGTIAVPPRILRSPLDLPPVAVAETLAGGAGIVDLWCFFYEGIDDAALLAEYDALMTPAERARRDRFVFEKDRRLYLATRALARTTLSAYAAVPADAWSFAEGSHGKPFITGPDPAPRLHFNLTNTPGLVVCAVSVAHEQLGVDAEYVARRGETVSIADSYFSAFEVRALRGLAPAEQPRRFFAYWTLKESYIKARGMGLALPLDQFSFHLDDADEIGITFDPRLGDDAARWRFSLIDASPVHTLAVGADTAGAPLSPRIASVVPLRGPVARWGGP
jgi:4'-phosphopantetheinyl transferase